MWQIYLSQICDPQVLEWISLLHEAWSLSSSTVSSLECQKRAVCEIWRSTQLPFLITINRFGWPDMFLFRPENNLYHTDKIDLVFKVIIFHQMLQVSIKLSTLQNQLLSTPRCWAYQTNWWTFSMSGVKRARREKTTRRIAIKGLHISFWPTLKYMSIVLWCLWTYSCVYVLQVSRVWGHLTYCCLAPLLHIVESGVHPSSNFQARHVALVNSISISIFNTLLKLKIADKLGQYTTTSRLSIHCVFLQWFFTEKIRNSNRIKVIKAHVTEIYRYLKRLNPKCKLSTFLWSTYI